MTLRRLLFALVALLAAASGAVAVTTTVAASSFTYDGAAFVRVDVLAIGAIGAGPAHLSDARDGAPASLAEASHMSTTPSPRSTATKAGSVLKGPIADAVPRNLIEQIALAEAKAGGGTQIMSNLADMPRLVANYGEGEWVKMQSVLRGTDGNTVVHWFKNLTTGVDVEFKFK